MLRDEPRNAVAHDLMGQLALAAGRKEAALEHIGKAVKIDPRYDGYRINLAVAHLRLGEPAEALAVLRRLIARPDAAGLAHLNAAVAQRALGDAKDALATVRAGSARHPGDRGLLLAEAEILTDLGDAAAATNAHQRLLDIDPDSAEAFASLADLGALDPAAEGRAAQLVSATHVPRLERAKLLYALGRLAEKRGDHDAAFARFSGAKALEGWRFDTAAYERLIDRLCALFSREFFAAKAGFGNPTRKPVFVVGLPRSGTSLIEQMLASHPSVHGAGELPFIERIQLRMTGKGTLEDGYRALTKADSRELARFYIAELERRGGAALRVIDKMPQNFETVGLIALLFPNAAIIHTVRDPLDNCLSLYTTQFNERHGYNADLATLARYYRAYRKLMDHWRSVLPDRVFDLRYEAVVADPEPELRRVLAHIGLDWDPGVLDFARTSRVVRTPSRWDVVRPLYTGSVGRWRRYEKHLRPLIEGLG